MSARDIGETEGTKDPAAEGRSRIRAPFVCDQSSPERLRLGGVRRGEPVYNFNAVVTASAPWLPGHA